MITTEFLQAAFGAKTDAFASQVSESMPNVNVISLEHQPQWVGLLLSQRIAEDLNNESYILEQFFNATQVERFAELAQQLEEDTVTYSNPVQMLSHPNVQAIKRLAPEFLIQEIFNRMPNRPLLWTIILGNVVGEWPISDADRGRVPAMVQSWRCWGADHGYRV